MGQWLYLIILTVERLALVCWDVYNMVLLCGRLDGEKLSNIYLCSELSDVTAKYKLNFHRNIVFAL